MEYKLLLTKTYLLAKKLEMTPTMKMNIYIYTHVSYMHTYKHTYVHTHIYIYIHKHGSVLIYIMLIKRD